MTVHFINNSAVTAAAARAANALAPATVGRARKSGAPLVAPEAPAPTVAALAREYNVDRRTIRRWQQKGWAPPAPATIQIVQQDQQVPTPAQGDGRPSLLGMTCLLLGLALAGVGLVINASYAASLGHTTGESSLLATLGLAVDGGAVILLSVAAALWQARHPMWSVLALAAWIGFTAASMIATAGFTSQSIGDHAAGRSAAIEQASDLRTQRAEAIAAAKAAVANAITARDQECGKVGENCRKRVRDLNLRQSELAAAVG